MNNPQPVRVRQVMTNRFQLVDGLMMVDQAIRLMKQSGAQVLIINKRNENDEYGMVLLSDIAREVLSTNRAPQRVNVYEVMSKPVVAVDPEMDIKYCARLFHQLGFNYAPVIDNGKVIGLVGYADLVLSGLVE